MPENLGVLVNTPPRLLMDRRYIPSKRAFVLLQGFVEILRCIVCLKTGEWPERLKDAEEIDVIEQQLASSVHVDDEARQLAIKNAKTIDEAAHHRIGQTKEINHE
jgi:hypothetical protein